MKLSVALAAYNGGRYIVEQLRSIMNQTRSVDEVVVVDDCSTDDTVRAVNAFLEENSLPGWRLLVNRENLGYAENFRKAIDACTGDLIFLCDQDDIWVESRVKTMTRVMEDNPEIGVLNTQSVPFRSDETPPSAPEPQPGDLLPQSIDLDRKNVFLQYPGCVMCIRKAFYEKNREYWSTGWAHDAFFWGMAVQTGTCYSISYVSLLRRFHKDQTSGKVGHGRVGRIKYLEGVRNNSETLLKTARMSSCPDKTIKLYERLMRAHQYRLELVRDRRFTRALMLIPYLGYYHRVRSYPVELMLALKGDR